MIQRLDERLRKLENLPTSIDRLADVIQTHSAQLSTTIPIALVYKIILIILLIVGGDAGIKLIAEKF